MKAKLIATIVLALFLGCMLLAPVGAQPNKPLRYEVSGESASYGWVGTIDSGDLDGYTGIWVTKVLIPRGGELFVDAKNVYFFEIWYIGEDITYVDGEDGFEIEGDYILAGFDKGVTRFANGKFSGNGIVTEAYGAWSHLIGHKEHLSGRVNFTDWTFTGTIQIN